jgi:hypothetical protein
MPRVGTGRPGGLRGYAGAAAAGSQGGGGPERSGPCTLAHHVSCSGTGLGHDDRRSRHQGKGAATKSSYARV